MADGCLQENSCLRKGLAHKKDLKVDRSFVLIGAIQFAASQSQSVVVTCYKTRPVVGWSVVSYKYTSVGRRLTVSPLLYVIPK